MQLVSARAPRRLLSFDSDNYGFSAWVRTISEPLKSIGHRLGRAVIYGEWFGTGIQAGVACSKVPRSFAVFAVQLWDDAGEEVLLVDPETIAYLLQPLPADTYVLPWYGPEVPIDFMAPSETNAVDVINALVEDVEINDPWVAETFGLHGTGEGVVMYPVAGPGVEYATNLTVPRAQITDLLFKAKGLAHRVKQQDKAVKPLADVYDATEFVAAYVTPQRLEQGLAEVCPTSSPTTADIGPFLQWVGRDVKDESLADREASGLAWKSVAKAVTTAARNWLLAKIREA